MVGGRAAGVVVVSAAIGALAWARPDSATFDTVAMRWKPAHLDTAKVYAVEVRAPSGPYTIWIERTGTIAGVEYPLGTRWMRTDFNMAVSDFRRTLATGAAAVRNSART